MLAQFLSDSKNNPYEGVAIICSSSSLVMGIISNNAMASTVIPVPTLVKITPISNNTMAIAATVIHASTSP
jgi:hypothetical protein